MIFIGTLIAFLNSSSSSTSEGLGSFVLDPSTYSNGLPIPAVNLAGHPLDIQQDQRLSFLPPMSPSQLEDYLIEHQPHLGAISILQWPPNSSKTYSITYNDTEVHSLPILFNTFNSIQYKQSHNGSISASIAPLGSR